MTPKQKAQELITDYRFILSLPDAPLGDMKDEVAKQCALHTAYSILDQVQELACVDPKSGVITYWQYTIDELNAM
jgi:hypothetical protein